MGPERLHSAWWGLLRHHPDPYSRHGDAVAGIKPAPCPSCRWPAGCPGLKPLIITAESMFVNVGRHQRHWLCQVQAPHQGGRNDGAPGWPAQAAGGERRPDHRHQHGRGDAGRRGRPWCASWNLIAGEPDIAQVPVMIDSPKWGGAGGGSPRNCVQGKPVVNSISHEGGRISSSSRPNCCAAMAPPSS